VGEEKKTTTKKTKPESQPEKKANTSISIVPVHSGPENCVRIRRLLLRQKMSFSSMNVLKKAT